jgi:hypothetical protein
MDRGTESTHGNGTPPQPPGKDTPRRGKPGPIPDPKLKAARARWSKYCQAYRRRLRITQREAAEIAQLKSHAGWNEWEQERCYPRDVEAVLQLLEAGATRYGRAAPPRPRAYSRPKQGEDDA